MGRSPGRHRDVTITLQWIIAEGNHGRTVCHFWGKCVFGGVGVLGGCSKTGELGLVEFTLYFIKMYMNKLQQRTTLKKTSKQAAITGVKN